MTTDSIPINDLSCAAALLTCGAKLDTASPFLKLLNDKGTTLTFFFIPDEKFKELIDIWDDPQKEPEHPMSYLKIFNMNKIGILKEVKEAVGLIQINKGGRTLLISSNASQEQKDKLLSRL